MDFLDELDANVLCGDGAMGTLLLAAGIPLEQCFEELCLSEPKRIRSIHDEYIASGARIIKTNTFGANRVRLARFGLQDRVKEINRAAARLASSCAAGRNVYVEASVGPLGVTLEEAAAQGIDRSEVFREQLEALIAAAPDLIFFETFTTFEEMELAFLVKRELSPCPAICSFACPPDGRLVCGTLIADAFERLEQRGAEVMGLNCMNHPAEMRRLLEHTGRPKRLAVYPTAGFPTTRHNALVYPVAPLAFGDGAPEIIARGVRVIGGCCGTTPAHIAALSSAVARCQ